MLINIYSEYEWIYPDTNVSAQSDDIVELEGAKGSRVAFQILTDVPINETSEIEFSVESKNLFQLSVLPYQLLSVNVEENTDDRLYTTLQYDKVKHIVTRKAPFRVFDALMPLGLCKPKNEIKAAFYIRIDIPQNSQTGIHNFNIKFCLDNNTATIPVKINVYSVVIPNPTCSPFLCNTNIWIQDMCDSHNVEKYSEEFFKVLDKYLIAQIETRNNSLKLPPPIPIRNSEGLVVDFDFNHVEKVANRAFKLGFKEVVGDYVSHWRAWNDEHYYLNWDREINIRTFEAYRQLSIYFEKWFAIICKNKWNDKIRQFLNDEPQIHNEMEYRALACIAREKMPGIRLIEPIETPKLYGAVDTWVVKQAVYDSNIEDFNKIQALGKEFWYYTCAFPTGKIVDRLLDIPLIVSRYIGWIPVKYNMNGYLHWAYNVNTEDNFEKTCLLFKYDEVNNKLNLPAGSAGIVYPYKQNVLQSVRAFAISAGIEDYELLMLLRKRDPEKADLLINNCIRSFTDYTEDINVFSRTRHELLIACDSINS